MHVQAHTHTYTLALPRVPLRARDSAGNRQIHDDAIVNTYVLVGKRVLGAYVCISQRTVHAFPSLRYVVHDSLIYGVSRSFRRICKRNVRFPKQPPSTRHRYFNYVGVAAV